MGKNKGHKSLPNQLALGAGKDLISSTIDLTGFSGEGQGARASCSNTKTTTAHQVFDKMQKSSSATAVGAGKDPIFSTIDLTGFAGEGQGVRASCSNTKTNTAHQVFEKMQKSSSARAKADVIHVFDIMTDCNAKTNSPLEDSYTLGEDDTSSDDDSSPSSDSDSTPLVATTEAAKPWVNLFKDNRKPSKGFGLQFSPPSSEEVLLVETDLQSLEKA